MTRPLFIAVAAVAALGIAPCTAAALTLEEAIQGAWSRNQGFVASARSAEAARLDAYAARDRRLPTLSLSAQAIGTDEPVAAFGMKLDQARIASADFDPARLNDPDFIGGYRASATLTQVLYGGGRIAAGRRAAESLAQASASDHERRRQELAVAVVEAYFGAQVAAEGARHAEDVLAHARETERFVRARAAEGAVLESEVARATAFRAQAEADLSAARQRIASARSALALLTGTNADDAALTSPIEVAPAPEPAPAGYRPDLAAGRSRAEAAREGVTAARGSLLPEVFAQASAETMRSSDLADGAGWVTLVLGARWQLGLADARALSAARAREDAAAAQLRWQERQADREVGEAKRAIESADARVRSASEAVAASESSRALRSARHRQGLLPLTDLLDAEAALAGSRALLLRSRLEARVSRAQHQLALGVPIEGVHP